MSIERLKTVEAGKAFEFEKKIYTVKSVSYKDLKFIIYTDKRTFVFFESELDVFIQDLIWVEVQKPDVKFEKGGIYTPNKFFPLEKKHTAEVITVNSRSLRIANRLEEVFNEISSGDLSDDKLKKATAMVNISNAIVANEVLNLRFMALQNK